MIHPELDSFLLSFHTLESLTAKGYVPSVHAVANHPDLKRLCLHAIEHPDREREVLSGKEIGILDQSCPNLTTLEVDMNTDGEWLSIHVELGVRQVELEWQLQHQLRRQLERQLRQQLREQYADEDDSKGMDQADRMHLDDWTHESMLSVLTEFKAHEFGKRFFGRRHEHSSLEKITLRTGEKLCGSSRERRNYLPDEGQYEKIFEIYPPPTKENEPFLKEVESERARMTREMNEGLDRKFGPLKRL
ncbi:hypothetical protein N7508_009912 [Penicillium antarcticum]|uniref:uncharacterized protein n=1 Tax=Penicillium antarcticum TaxID=416450 RepID=UPI002389FA2E|nr:uncharacterized protein N7508_009912 [Penicillium antarcticum]KAJ5295091.1 hypothetical protein N7508_009912 [Penicillium antarcticum]